MIPGGDYLNKRLKLRLIYNLLIILIALIIGFYNFPNTLSEFAFIVAGIGFFLTLGLLIPKTKRNIKIAFMITFLITFSLVFAVTY
jgi:predicted Kef-type K+ transport protein